MDDTTRSDSLRELEERRREARRSVEEAGGGQAEGFELAEQELIEHTSHGDEHTPARIMRDAAGEGAADEGAAGEGVADEGLYGEADEEHKAD